MEKEECNNTHLPIEKTPCYIFQIIMYFLRDLCMMVILVRQRKE
jgi:hypothetical protein